MSEPAGSQPAKSQSARPSGRMHISRPEKIRALEEDPPGHYTIFRAVDASPEEIRTLDSQDLEFHCPLDNGRHDITSAFSSQDLGTLSPLPAELVWSILKHLDIPTLATFRRVCKRAMHMVDTTFEYQQIMDRAPQIIRGTLTLEADSFTVNDAYITLSDDACMACGRPGGFIYLITCERLCSLCLVNPDRWRHKPRDNMRPTWDHTGNSQTRPRPSAVARPGIYGTTGGYHIVSDNIMFKGHWVRKNFSSQFWDYRYSGPKRLSMPSEPFAGLPWFATQFFVTVSAPLVNRQGRGGGEEG